MKTEAKLKKLAEFAAEFLKLPIADNPINKGFYVLPINGGRAVAPEHLASWFFNRPERSSYLAHLAKREMEKRGFAWDSNKFYRQGYQYRFEKVKVTDKELLAGPPPWNRNENEYIALWSAIEEANG